MGTVHVHNEIHSFVDKIMVELILEYHSVYCVYIMYIILYTILYYTVCIACVHV